MGQAFRLLLEEWLGRFGLLFVDPLAPEIRALGAPVAAGDGAEAELSTALLERNKDLESSGYHAQVHIEPKTSLFSCWRTDVRFLEARERRVSRA